MISSEIFSEFSKDWGAIYSYLRLKEILGISRGCTKSGVDAVFTFKKMNPDQYNRIIGELEYQVCVLSLSKRWPFGIHQALFNASVLPFASPMSLSDPNPCLLQEFESMIRQGHIGIE